MLLLFLRLYAHDECRTSWVSAHDGHEILLAREVAYKVEHHRMNAARSLYACLYHASVYKLVQVALSNLIQYKDSVDLPSMNKAFRHPPPDQGVLLHRIISRERAKMQQAEP